MPIVGITVLAAILRLYALGKTPPGLYHDEAFNGLDALQVLAGHRPLYFAANHGREPLFIYTIAVTVGLLGRTPSALRLAAAICGTLTIPATYMMARSWFSQRVASLSAAILAVTVWHIHLSRIGFRAVTLPLTTALALWLGARAWKSRRWYAWLLAGLAFGLCFYAYLPARLTPIALIIFCLYLLRTGRTRRLWPGATWFVAGASVILLPLAVYATRHWDVVMGRPGQVWAFGSPAPGSDLLITLGRQVVGTLGMFFVRGDAIPRHNVPGRPVFDPLMGTAMVLGLIRMARQARRNAASAFSLIWIGVMLIPTLLSQDVPHFLRAVGVLPILTVLPAQGIDSAMNWLVRRGRATWSPVLACVLLAVSLTTSVWDYCRYGSVPQTAYAFEEAATNLAAQTNRFTGLGWDGSSLTVPNNQTEAHRLVYIDHRLWDEWAAIPFLVPESERVIKIPSDSDPPPGKATLLLLWPYEGLGRYQDLLPRGAQITARSGTPAQGDLEDTPYESFIIYTAEPADIPDLPLARFGEQIALVDYDIEVHEKAWHVRLIWQALVPPVDDYTVFLHLLDGEQLVAQADKEPAMGRYPTRLWREGDVVADTHVLTAPGEWQDEPRLVLGLYTWPTLARLDVTSPIGKPVGDELELTSLQ